jgi:hypothetical protein
MIKLKRLALAAEERRIANFIEFVAFGASDGLLSDSSSRLIVDVEHDREAYARGRYSAFS